LYLRERFHQDKIYVTASRGQVFWESGWSNNIPNCSTLYRQWADGEHHRKRCHGYELALDYLTKRGDTKTLEILHRNGPPPYSGEDVVSRYVAYLDILNEIMGTPRYTLIVPIVPFIAPEYGYVDKINHTRV